ncbi:MAG: hypothetical protein IT428_32150 [Planctomycetaceae bacterium]|nr:hypothetical protein [Planctomycetaceae bacterium]
MISLANHPERYALIGVGTSGDWEATLSEVLSGDEEDFLLELSGPTMAMAVHISSIEVASRLRRTLMQRLDPQSSPTPGFSEVRFDESLRLVCDNEDFPRCFLLARTTSGAVRLTLNERDLRELSESLRDMIDEARQDSESKPVSQPVDPA